MRLLARVLAVLWMAVLACDEPQPIPVTPEITTSALEDGTVGIPYSGRLRAHGGTGPYSWSLESVPAELGWLKVETVDSTIGQLGGNPDKHGSFSFRAQVTDSKGRVSSPRSFALTVKACKEDEPVPCYYVANEQCYTNSLICTNGDISGTCGNGTLSDDVNHCGAGANGTCGTCSPTVADNCQGTCMCGTSAACSGSTSCCSQNCVNLQTDASNCGVCGHTCPAPGIEHAYAACSNGQCGSACDTDYMSCSTGCCPQASAVSASETHSCALLKNGIVKCWGGNTYGQLGNNSTSESHLPVAAYGLQGATAIGASSRHTCAITNSGGVQCWGLNDHGQLGNDSISNNYIPVAVHNLSSATAISVGFTHTCALISDGSVRCWGYNSNGQLGNNTQVDSRVPVSVVNSSGTTLTGFTAITTDNGSTYALAGGGLQWWGYRPYSLTGSGTNSSSVPVADSGISGATAITVRGQHACVIVDGGAVQCWGYNGAGILGNGSTLNGYILVSVVSSPGTAITGITAIAAGVSHTCSITNSDSVQCWGLNDHGQLGNGSTNDSHVSYTVPDLSGATSIAAGAYHTCAVVSGGKVQCWGLNDHGQLGTGNTDESHVPVLVQF